MPIASAMQRGSLVYVYDEKGSLIRTITGELQGFTQSTFTIKYSNSLITYDDKGNYKFAYTI